jgi:type I restriction enzyme, S subunit
MNDTGNKQPTSDPSVVADADLPQGWERSALGAIGQYLNGRAFKTTEWSKRGRPIIRIQDLTGTKSNPNYFQGHIEDRYVVRPGDFLISWSATLGAYLWHGPEGVLNQHIFKVRSYIDKNFHRRLVQFIIDDLYRETHGSGMVHITKGNFADIPVSIPPAQEQLRIVARIEELFTQVNAARARLAKVAQLLKRFRQAVLADACSNGESLPLSEVLSDIKYGTAQKCTPVPTGSPVLRIPNIGDGSVRLADLKYAKLPSKELAALQLMPGDILMIRSNGSVSLVGKTALVSEKEAGFAYAGYLMRLRTKRGRVLPEYLNLALQTHIVREQIEVPARSTSGVHNINSTEVMGLKVSVPDMDTQRIVVRRVEALFAHADAIERQVEAATKRAEKLAQAILAKAFRGELVPTEAEVARREGRDYEPASLLLERIRASHGRTAQRTIGGNVSRRIGTGARKRS